jgi:uncharacterized protein (TIGR02996 family)
MSEERAFLHRLQTHPDDDVTRLVYADWLDEQGDPRAAYLRGEVELSSLAEGTEPYHALTLQQRELGATLDPEWLPLVGKRYDVVLVAYPVELKIACIKVIRELSHCGLRQAKDLSETLPATVLRGVMRDTAATALAQFTRFRSVGEQPTVIVRPSPVDSLIETPPIYPQGVPARFHLYLLSFPEEELETFILTLRHLTEFPRNDSGYYNAARALADVRLGDSVRIRGFVNRAVAETVVEFLLPSSGQWEIR